MKNSHTFNWSKINSLKNFPDFTSKSIRTYSINSATAPYNNSIGNDAAANKNKTKY